MDSFAQADIFFFISSCALIVITMLFVAILLYVLRIVRTISEIAHMAKTKVKEFSHILDEVEGSIENSSIIRWIKILGTRTKKKKVRTTSP